MREKKAPKRIIKPDGGANVVHFGIYKSLGYGGLKKKKKTTTKRKIIVTPALLDAATEGVVLSPKLSNVIEDLVVKYTEGIVHEAMRHTAKEGRKFVSFDDVVLAIEDRGRLPKSPHPE